MNKCLQKKKIVGFFSAKFVCSGEFYHPIEFFILDTLFIEREGKTTTFNVRFVQIKDSQLEMSWREKQDDGSFSMLEVIRRMS